MIKKTIVCDKCGKELDEETSSSSVVLFVTELGKTTRMDLCSDCASEVMNWKGSDE